MTDTLCEIILGVGILAFLAGVVISAINGSKSKTNTVHFNPRPPGVRKPDPPPAPHRSNRTDSPWTDHLD